MTDTVRTEPEAPGHGGAPAPGQGAGTRGARLRRLTRSPAVRIGAAALAWLVTISALHHVRNGDRSKARVIRMGHMPVLANLAAPLLDAASEGREPRFSAMKFASFAEMAQALRAGTIDVAFIIAPLPLVLQSQGVPVRIVAIGNRHESTLVARKELGIGRGQFRLLAGRTVAVPIRYSGHTLALRRLLRQNGMPEDGVRVVEMQPPDMAPALQNGSLDAYFVGEPFAARSVAAGTGTVVTYVEDVWPRFLCNLMVVREETTRKERDLVARLVRGVVRSGLWAGTHRREAAGIAARLWGQPPELLLSAMDTPPGRVRFDLAVPRRDEVAELFDEMVAARLLPEEARHVVAEVVDDSFARGVTGAGLTGDVRSILAGSP